MKTREGKIKLVRFIASATGLGRRRAMDLLENGRVRVNGATATDSTLGVDPAADRVAVDGKMLVPAKQLYLLLYKPRKTISARTDPRGRTTIMHYLPRRLSRAFPVGRLDYHTTGVLLLTTDGALASALLKPGRVRRSYMVKLAGNVSLKSFERWRKGLTIDGRRTSGAEVKILERGNGKARVMVTVTEGWYHLIHRMAERTGMRALKIHRARFAGITLGGLKPGEHRHLTDREVRRLMKLAREKTSRDPGGSTGCTARRNPSSSRSR